MPTLNLFERLSTLPDHRVQKKTLHRLDEMAFVAICAVISGAEGWSDIVEFAHAKLAWLKQFVRLEKGIPVDDTFARVLSVLSPKAFTECLLAWTQDLAAHCPGEVIAIDGKSARRSHDRKHRRNPLHLVRAWATTQGVALGMVKTEAKSNEITAIPELLKLLELKGALVTIDAMGCQTAIAEQIVRQGGDYLLAVKENQPSLHEAIRDFFETGRAHQFSGIEHSFSEHVDADHGRVEIRRCWASECLQTLDNPSRWFGLKSIVMIERERMVDQKVSLEQAYYLTSLPAHAEKLAQGARAHWSVENSCHWVIDVTFNEDQSRIRRGEGAHNFAVLRQFALNLLKLDKSKASIRRKLFRASLNDDFRLQVLAVAG
jgi:predicted transposase YbfD/YdcC